MRLLTPCFFATCLLAIAGCRNDSSAGPSGASSTTTGAGGQAGSGGSGPSGGGMGGIGGGVAGAGGIAGAGGAAGSAGVGGMGGIAGAGGGIGGAGGAATTTSTSTTSTSSATGTGGGGGQGGAGGGDCGPPIDGAVITHTGQPGTLLLRGMVLTPEVSFAGEVLVESDTITCVAASCAAAPGAANASIVETHGIILPGLVDAHNHVLFDIFDETHWTPSMVYTNHNQWVNEPKYSAMLDVKQYLNSEGSSPVDYSCELDKYGELKGLVGGSTSIIGHTGLGRTCYGSLTRTIEQSQNGLGADKIQVSSLFPPSTSSADGVCNNFTTGKTAAYLIHCGEGVDAVALAEFGTLGTVTTVDDCLYAPQTALVHATAFGDPELTIMAQHGMSLVWSPRVNVFLYGGGTDLTKGPNIPLALAKGINVALGADWSLGGSQNLLDEMRFADKVDHATFGDILTSKMLVQMATRNGAKALGLDAVLGSLEVGKKADILVIGGDAANPYDAVLAATPFDVRLVLVGGAALYGDPALVALGAPNPGCEALDVCCRSKFLCVALPGGTPTDKFGQTYADIKSTLETALADYDAMHLSQWTWSPMTPLVRCQ